ncbi:hypothetical protein D3C71_1331940 [compost metagenome]
MAEQQLPGLILKLPSEPVIDILPKSEAAAVDDRDQGEGQAVYQNSLPVQPALLQTVRKMAQHPREEGISDIGGRQEDNSRQIHRQMALDLACKQ